MVSCSFREIILLDYRDSLLLLAESDFWPIFKQITLMLPWRALKRDWRYSQFSFEHLLRIYCADFIIYTMKTTVCVEYCCWHDWAWKENVVLSMVTLPWRHSSLFLYLALVKRMTSIPMVFFLHFLCLSLPLSLAFSIWFHALMMIVRLAFPFVCLLTQTNALISLDLGVRLCKLLFIKHIDSRAARIKNTWSNWKIHIRVFNEIRLYELICLCLRG